MATLTQCRAARYYYYYYCCCYCCCCCDVIIIVIIIVIVTVMCYILLFLTGSCYRGCLCYPYCRSRRFEGDGLVANASVLSTTLGMPQSNIVTASFVNSVYTLPYFVINDPIRKELVVTIRGTFSIHVGFQ